MPASSSSAFAARPGMCCRIRSPAGSTGSRPRPTWRSASWTASARSRWTRSIDSTLPSAAAEWCSTISCHLRLSAAGSQANLGAFVSAAFRCVCAASTSPGCELSDGFLSGSLSSGGNRRASGWNDACVSAARAGVRAAAPQASAARMQRVIPNTSTLHPSASSAPCRGDVATKIGL